MPFHREGKVRAPKFIVIDFNSARYFHGIFVKSTLLNACFFPTFFDFTFPASTHLLSVSGDTFSSKAASFNVNHSLAWTALISPSVINAFGSCITIVSNFTRLIAFSRCLTLCNRFAQGSEHVAVVVFLAMNSCLQNAQILTILKLLLIRGYLLGLSRYRNRIIPYIIVSYRIIPYQFPMLISGRSSENRLVPD
jgi:hypothetical protein